MNKKTLLLLLGVCFSTSLTPTITFAEENIVLQSETEYNLGEMRDDNDNYVISYEQLENYYNTYDCYLYKGQDFIPTFILHNSNIQNLLNSKDKSFVLKFDINGESFSESPSVLTGLSKEFYDTHSKQIYRWVYYKSNLGNENFKNNNTISFPLESRDLKVGDKVYLYTTSKEGKAELISEVVLNNSNISEDMGFGQVTFETNIDVSDRTFFLTTSKINIVDNNKTTSSTVSPNNTGNTNNSNSSNQSSTSDKVSSSQSSTTTNSEPLSSQEVVEKEVATSSQGIPKAVLLVGGIVVVTSLGYMAINKKKQ